MTQIAKKLFSKELQKELYPDNAFYKMSKVDAGISADVESVDVPQQGSPPDVIVNPNQFPLPVETREDAVKNYSVDYIATKPQVVVDMKAIILSYDKRQNMIQDHALTLNNEIAKRIGNAWCPTPATAAFVRQTTGSGTRPAGTGLTGTRKKTTLDDLAWAALALDQQEIPQEGRVAVFPATMYNDLLTIDEFVAYNNSVGTFGDLLSKGFVGEIYGFKVMKRSTVVYYTEDATLTNIVKRPVNATLNATDNEGAIFWHPSFVRRAEGNVKTYIKTDDPGYQGTIISAAVRSGGSPGRTDGKGLVVLIQDN